MPERLQLQTGRSGRTSEQEPNNVMLAACCNAPWECREAEARSPQRRGARLRSGPRGSAEARCWAGTGSGGEHRGMKTSPRTARNDGCFDFRGWYQPPCRPPTVTVMDGGEGGLGQGGRRPCGAQGSSCFSTGMLWRQERSHQHTPDDSSPIHTRSLSPQAEEQAGVPMASTELCPACQDP